MHTQAVLTLWLKQVFTLSQYHHVFERAPDQGYDRGIPFCSSSSSSSSSSESGVTRASGPHVPVIVNVCEV